MPVEYVEVEEAIARTGLRMVVVGGVPSPWSEAAKGILRLKSIPWSAVRLVYDSEALRQWAGQRSGPVAIFDSEPPRHSWSDILLLAERLAPEPPTLPADALDRALALGIAHEICGEGGLGWSRRLQLIHSGLAGQGGFPERTCRYLGRKYGYTASAGEVAGARVRALLDMLAARLKRQQEAGSPFYFGPTVGAVDIYSATFMALFTPLPEAVCAMDAATRAAFETLDAATQAALDPVLLAHRDMIYADFMELPLSL